MRLVSGIPIEKAKAFAHSLCTLLSSDDSRRKIDKVEQLNQKLKGWAQFHRHTVFTAKVYCKIDQIVFLKLARCLRPEVSLQYQAITLEMVQAARATQG